MKFWILQKKIDTPYFIDFFKSRFNDTGKIIQDEAAELIVKLVDNHPYYAQQLARQAWLQTEKVCTCKIVTKAHYAIIAQLELLFTMVTEGLTNQQLNYLEALLSGEKDISSSEVMYKYKISSATSIARSKAALVKNDILDITGKTILFQDPMYAYWLKHIYFKI